MQNPLEGPINKMAAAWDKLKPRLVKLMGAVTLSFIDDNFQKQGFQGDVFEPWTPRKDPKDQGRPILFGKGSGMLRRSPFVSYSDAERAIITSSLPYSRIHNEGGNINHPEHKVTLNFNKHGHFGKVQTIKQQRQIKSINHAKVGEHSSSMPRRQYMGRSPVHTQRIREMLNKEIPTAFKIIR